MSMKHLEERQKEADMKENIMQPRGCFRFIEKWNGMLRVLLTILKKHHRHMEIRQLL